VIFSEPIWLLLTIPAVLILRATLAGSRLQRGLRIAATALMILAVAGPALILSRQVGRVIAVVDRSKSMPPGADERALELLDLLRDDMPSDARLGVVSFGFDAAVESLPSRDEAAGLNARLDEDGSNLHRALDTALGLIPEGGSGRLLILSDGRWTGPDPRERAGTAATRGIPLDYRVMDRPGGDLAISEISAPNRISAREGMLITAFISGDRAQTIDYELLRNGRPISRGSRAVRAGDDRLVFRDMAPVSGTLSYELRIAGEDEDPIPQNNRARFLVDVDAPRGILLVAEDRGSSLARLLRAGGLDVTVQTPIETRFSLDELSGHAALILENVPAEAIGRTGMANIAAWVTETGAGLITTGGQNAYGVGGWYKSPLEPVLPVTMELRRDHQKQALAMVIAVDRSGSMTQPVTVSLAKIDLANIAAAEVVGLLSPIDEIGHIAVDTRPETVIDLRRVDDPGAIRERILELGSSGGGINVYPALVAATKMVAEAAAPTKHIILFSDAADSNEPGNYKELLAKTSAAGITVSVVGLGIENDPHVPLLRDIAERGGGNFYLTNDPLTLPRIFAQDTFVISRRGFIEEPTPITVRAGLQIVTGSAFGQPPALGGYNLCYARDEVALGLTTTDEHRAPVLASWFAGNGRVASFTGEAAGSFAGPFAGWARVGDFYTSIARWAAGAGESLPGGSMLTLVQDRGVARVILHLDPSRETNPFAAVPELNVLRGAPGDAPERETVRMRWHDPHALIAELPIRGDETLLPTLSLDGAAVATAAPVRLPYSPEYLPETGERGVSELAALAEITGGRERTTMTRIWKELPPRENRFPLAPYLLAAAMLLFLLEIVERRMGLHFSLRRTPARTETRVEPEQARRSPTGRRAPDQPGPEVPQSEPEPEPAATSGLQSALDRAGKRAKQRSGREG